MNLSVRVSLGDACYQILYTMVNPHYYLGSYHLINHISQRITIEYQILFPQSEINDVYMVN